MIVVTKYSPEELISLRQKFDMSQTEFWNAVNVSQSGGSRYEAGRPVPDQVLILIELIYERNLNLDTATQRAKLKLKNSDWRIKFELII